FGILNDTLKVNATTIGLSLFTEDRMQGSENSNGIYALTLEANNEPIFGFNFDKLLGFDEGRKIAGHMEHRTHKLTGTKYHRCYRLPGNYLSVYHKEKGDGYIKLEEGEVKKIDIAAYDFFKNKMAISFFLQQD